jgi:ribosomal subunit interface protein
MKTNIKATNIELTEAIREYALKRLSKLEKYLSEDVVVSVELGKTSDHHKQGEIFRAEVRVAGGGMDHYVSRESDNLYTAIDQVENDIVQEITKDKSKKRELIRRGQRAIKDMVRGFPWIKWRR